MIRYSIISEKQKREIALLKGYPCAWGRCSFCDYIDDNTADTEEMNRINKQALSRVTGLYGALEIVNSGSVFELSGETLSCIKETARAKGIGKLFFEAGYMYRERLPEIREYFNCEIIFKCGIETFDNAFRNGVLNKGIEFSSPEEVAAYFDSVCLLVGIMGQTQEMIDRDIKILTGYFKYGCINLYKENSTPIRADAGIIRWFKEKYGRMDNYPNIDVMWDNTDFGIGGFDEKDVFKHNS